MRNLISRLVNDQRIRFLAVGGVNTAVGYALFVVFEYSLFSGLALGYLASFAASYAIAIGLAFILYRRLVFKVSGNILGDLVRFVGVYSVAITINVFALPVLIEGAHLPSFAAQAVILVVTTVLSFFGHKKVSFARKLENEETGPKKASDATKGVAV